MRYLIHNGKHLSVEDLLFYKSKILKYSYYLKSQVRQKKCQDSAYWYHWNLSTFKL